MPTTDTPLRYPGGKSQLRPLVIDILKENDLIGGEYAEPFAGGAGIAMSLLLNGHVSRVYLNDIDPAIYAFWYSVLHKTKELCDRIENTSVNTYEWLCQRHIFKGITKSNVLDKGFATFYLNRTNRSGILRGGVIGGLDQSGKYKLDCRYNQVNLVKKIKRIAEFKDQIVLSRLDAVNFLNKVVTGTSENILVNLDPPYYGKGPELYTNFYKPQDHAVLAQAISKLKKRWIVTYDDTPEIRTLYANYPMYGSSLNYSAQVKRVGVELLITDSKIKVPAYLTLPKMECIL